MSLLKHLFLSLTIAFAVLLGLPASTHAGGGPDLIVSKVEHRKAGNQEFLRITVKNRGTSASGQFKVRVQGQNGTNNNQLTTVQNLQAGKSFTFDHYPRAECEFKRTITVDAFKQVKETWMMKWNGTWINMGENNNSLKVDDDFCIA